MQTQSQDRIAQLAYQLWQERGCPDGSPEVDWEHALRTLETATAPDNEVLSVPPSAPPAATNQPAPNGNPAPGATSGGASSLRSRGRGRSLNRSAI